MALRLISNRDLARRAIAAHRAADDLREATRSALENGARPLSSREVARVDDLTIFERINGEVTINHYEGWRRHLTWQHVFDLKLPLNIHGISEKARESGYRFFAFDNLIYFVSRRGFIEHTGFTTDDVNKNGDQL